MRNSRFIELLNLYVDRQLSKEDAVELEREIARNPARSKMYQQYCRMQKACTLLFDQERNQAPNTNLLARSLSDADRKVIGFPGSRVSRWRSGSLYAASLAAAACIAFAIVNRAEIAGIMRPHTGTAFASHDSTPASLGNNTVLAQRSSSALGSMGTGLFATKATKTPIALAASSAPARRSEYFAVFTAKPSLRDENAGDLVLEGQAEDRNSYEWMRSIELAPVAPFASEQITLVSSAVKSPTINLRSRSGSHDGENAAFEFQR